MLRINPDGMCAYTGTTAKHFAREEWYNYIWLTGRHVSLPSNETFYFKHRECFVALQLNKIMLQ